MSNPEVRYTHSRYCSGSLSCASPVYSGPETGGVAFWPKATRKKRTITLNNTTFVLVSMQAVSHRPLAKGQTGYCADRAIPCILGHAERTIEYDSHYGRDPHTLSVPTMV